MKKVQFFAISALLSISCAQAVLVTLPSKEILEKRFNEMGLTYFVEKSKIVNKAAGEEKEALGVAMLVELSIHDYIEYLKKGMPAPMVNISAAQMQMSKPHIFEILLKDSPEALKELQDAGLYTPSK